MSSSSGVGVGSGSMSPARTVSSARISSSDQVPELFTDLGCHGPCTAAAVAGSILRSVHPPLPAPMAWVNTSVGALPKWRFISSVAVKYASTCTCGQGSPIPLLATSHAHVVELPVSLGTTPRDIVTGPPLPAVLAAPAATIHTDPSRMIVALPTGASSQPSVCQAMSFSGVVEL